MEDYKDLRFRLRITVPQQIAGSDLNVQGHSRPFTQALQVLNITGQKFMTLYYHLRRHIVFRELHGVKRLNSRNEQME